MEYEALKVDVHNIAAGPPIENATLDLTSGIYK